MVSSGRSSFRALYLAMVALPSIGLVVQGVVEVLTTGTRPVAWVQASLLHRANVGFWRLVGIVGVGAVYVATVRALGYNIPLVTAASRIRGSVASWLTKSSPSWQVPARCIETVCEPLGIERHPPCGYAAKSSLRERYDGRLTVRLRDGCVMTATETQAFGPPTHPVAPSHVTAEFTDCASRVLEAPKIEKLIESLHTDVTELVRLSVPSVDAHG